MDLDTLNTSVGKFIDVFLDACPEINEGEAPFDHDDILRTMRDTIIDATGRSGLIVRHRLIENIRYFLIAVSSWASHHLIGALREGSSDALSLWRSLARGRAALPT